MDGSSDGNTTNLTLTTELQSSTRVPSNYTKITCPRFDVEDFRGWLLKMEQFFVVDNTPENDKVRLVMMHLDERALQWHQWFMVNQGNINEVTWPYYLHHMKHRFCNPEFLDPMFELSRVRHTGTVEEYYLEFESWLNMVRLPDSQALGLFMSNLKSDICDHVRLYEP